MFIARAARRPASPCASSTKPQAQDGNRCVIDLGAQHLAVGIAPRIDKAPGDAGRLLDLTENEDERMEDVRTHIAERAGAVFSISEPFEPHLWMRFVPDRAVPRDMDVGDRPEPTFVNEFLHVGERRNRLDEGVHGTDQMARALKLQHGPGLREIDRERDVVVDVLAGLECSHRHRDAERRAGAADEDVYGGIPHHRAEVPEGLPDAQPLRCRLGGLLT